MRPGEKFIPYVNPPEYPNPDEWAFYPTTCRECPAGCGMLMWHRDGRITKAEGNPLHPVNKGRLCIRGQSSVQGEYVPGRIKNVLEKDLNGGWITGSWELTIPAIRNILKVKKPVLLSGIETGSLAGIMEEFASAYSTKPIYYEAFNYESLRLGGKEAYGSDLIPRFNLSGCDLILSFNADFLETWLSPVEYARDFAELHSPEGHPPGRLIYFGYSENLTALNADDFFVTSPGSHASILYNIALTLRKKGAVRNPDFPEYAWDNIRPDYSSVEESDVARVSELIRQAKSPIVLAGRANDFSSDGMATVKAAYFLNELLGNRSRIDFSQYHALSSSAYRKDIHDQFSSITSDNVVIIHNTNPVYTEPGFEQYLKKAAATIYIGPVANETSAVSNFVLPSDYPLEEWGDYEPWKGTVSLLQPVMNPLYDSKSSGDIFLDLARTAEHRPYSEIVRNNHKDWLLNNSDKVHENTKPGISPEQVMRSSHLSISPVKSSPVFSFTSSGDVTVAHKPAEGEIFIDPVPSLFFYDGRLADRSWLQEIPDPVSDIVWQSRIDINPGSTSLSDIKAGKILKVISQSGTIEGAARLTAKTAINTISISTGQGHWSYGETADGRGSNVFSVIPYNYKGSLPFVKINKTRSTNNPVYLNYTREQHGRELLKFISHGKYPSKEEITLPLPSGYKRDFDLYPPHQHEGHRWAMVIDLQRCIGCMACVAACYAENNIPVMGQKNCREGLEMAWLKVPAYRTVNDKIAFIPVPCQHCDAAPCEPVCPTYASSHTKEGLNAQIYNRCIGTRYCSNNCPYKVRRFNWKNIGHKYPETLQLNPEISVRSRGVMEKCTFCVQRIRYAEYSAKRENRQLKDGEIVPACAQTCPAGAIFFGDLLDPASNVSRLFDNERRYQLLHELNTKPAVVYLKKIIHSS
jgi:molybdopterin-containing oxidoreductase family iron-sulfur binding subunit